MWRRAGYNALCMLMLPGVRPIALLLAFLALVGSFGVGLWWLGFINAFFALRHMNTLRYFGREGFALPVTSALIALATLVVSIFMIFQAV